VREIDRMDRNAERLEQHGARGVESRRDRVQCRLRHGDVFGHRAVARRVAEELHVRTEVGMSAVAPFAYAAWMRRVDRDERALGQPRSRRGVAGDHARKLVAEHDRAHLGRPRGAAFDVRMDVAAADTDGLDA
jgi:hypothetical protein